MKFFIVALFACIAVASASGIIGAPYGLAPVGIVSAPAIATTGYTTATLGGIGCAGLGCGLGSGKLLAGPAYIGSPALIGGPIGYSNGLIGGKTLIGGPIAYSNGLGLIGGKTIIG